MNALVTQRQQSGLLTRLSKNLQVRRTLAGNGRLHMDRMLPFICVYRRPADRSDPGTDRLVVTSASYLLADGGQKWVAGTEALLEPIAELMVERFGAFLLLELWSSPKEVIQPEHAPPQPEFNVFHHQADGKMSDTLAAACKSLEKIRISKRAAVAELHPVKACAPPGMPPIFKPRQMSKIGVHWLGVEVSPIHVNPEDGEPFPLLLRLLRRQMGYALDRIFFEFARECTTHHPAHFHTLGRRAMVKAVWDVDQRLNKVGSSFDLLHQITPVNVEKEWHRFQRRHFEVPPHFLYRPCVVDPGKMKAQLYGIPIDRVEDPTLMNLFLGKQRELDRQLTLLMDRNQPAFLCGSQQLYGKIPDQTRQTARDILEKFHDRPHRSRRMLDADAIFTLAQTEISAYREAAPGFTGDVRISDSIYAGLMVSQGCLLIGRGASVPEERAEALIQHEVGTHVLTWSNGQAQPFKMLATGLPGYDGLQEGIAVLAEHLVGGLDAARLRLLAIRVEAVHAMIEGASFIEVFRLLTREYGFAQRSAYMVAMRVFRGGGLTKDAIYLHGLVEVLNYLGDGGELEPLFAGKFALNHISMVEELSLRRVLSPPAVLPRYLTGPEAQDRLAKIREGLDVQQLGLKQLKRK